MLYSHVVAFEPVHIISYRVLDRIGGALLNVLFEVPNPCCREVLDTNPAKINQSDRAYMNVRRFDKATALSRYEAELINWVYLVDHRPGDRCWN